MKLLLPTLAAPATTLIAPPRLASFWANLLPATVEVARAVTAPPWANVAEVLLALNSLAPMSQLRAARQRDGAAAVDGQIAGEAAALERRAAAVGIDTPAEVVGAVVGEYNIAQV